jgi:hypothetical protein
MKVNRAMRAALSTALACMVAFSACASASASARPTDPGHDGKYAMSPGISATSFVTPRLTNSVAAVHPLVPTAPTATPVIFIHGNSPALPCAGYQSYSQYWSGANTVLGLGGWTGTVSYADYYQCDTEGTDITVFGNTNPLTYYGNTGPITANTDIRHLAYLLAWYVYTTYSNKGIPVDLVGHSMGGLMMRWALYQVQIRNPLFPPLLYVTNAVTISTPHAGVGSTANCANFECDQYTVGSSFITELQAHPWLTQGVGGTDWTTIGSEGCDLVNYASALAMPSSHRFDYTSPCYYHNNYQWDLSSATNTSAKYGFPNNQAVYTTTTGLHSLYLMKTALLSTGA